MVLPAKRVYIAYGDKTTQRNWSKNSGNLVVPAFLNAFHEFTLNHLSPE